ncbi:hypothetical protein NUW54_g14299 [Trametes sanguinea]|uniref:Uncharacterized protein n=1 Tax=Trametes sanguinea TaxID=158606 RepID=A0ACC1ME84_9APHY|nr:hypothetical protein NUW54_g14299 [Trametes sanguinea]
MVEAKWLASEYGKKFDRRILIADALVDVPTVGAGLTGNVADGAGQGGNRAQGSDEDELEYLDPRLRD